MSDTPTPEQVEKAVERIRCYHSGEMLPGHVVRTARTTIEHAIAAGYHVIPVPDEQPCSNDCERFGRKVPGHTVGSNWDWVPCPEGHPLPTDDEKLADRLRAECVEFHGTHDATDRCDYLEAADAVTEPTPSHSATMRELEQTRAERDAAEAESQRLREGIKGAVTWLEAARRPSTLLQMLWALLTEQPEGETPAFMDQSNLPDTPRDRPRNPVALTKAIPVTEQPEGET